MWILFGISPLLQWKHTRCFGLLDGLVFLGPSPLVSPFQTLFECLLVSENRTGSSSFLLSFLVLIVLEAAQISSRNTGISRSSEYNLRVFGLCSFSVHCLQAFLFGILPRLLALEANCLHCRQ